MFGYHSDSEHKSKKEIKKEKLEKRKQRDLRLFLAMRQHEISAKQLKTSSGGFQKPEKEGLDDDISSKVGTKIQSLRSGLHASREQARRRADMVFAR